MTDCACKIARLRGWSDYFGADADSRVVVPVSQFNTTSFVMLRTKPLPETTKSVMHRSVGFAETEIIAIAGFCWAYEVYEVVAPRVYPRVSTAVGAGVLVALVVMAAASACLLWIVLKS